MYSQNNKIILHVSRKPQNIYSAIKSLSRLNYFYISNINAQRERNLLYHFTQHTDEQRNRLHFKVRDRAKEREPKKREESHKSSGTNSKI